MLDYVRWVMVRKKRHGCARARSGGARSCRAWSDPGSLILPEGAGFPRITTSRWPVKRQSAGPITRWARSIDHVDGVTIEEAEHMMATRLWQNTSKTHFDVTPRARPAAA